MNPATLIYHELLFRPLFNLLVGITGIIPGHNVGWAIILVTGFVRLLLLPPSLYQAKHLQHNQEKMKQLQPEIERVNERHKNDKMKRAEATMSLYRQAGINPARGCLPLLVQLPILIALYRVFFIGITPDSISYLYPFITMPSTITMTFFGIDLARPSVLLAVLAGLGQFMQMKWLTTAPAEQPGAGKDTAEIMAAMQRNMSYIFPAMTVFISFQLPAALALYWVASILLAVIQQQAVKRILHLSATPPSV